MRLIKHALVFAVAFVGLSVSPARAQEIVRVKVPFPFEVGSKQFPAGSYDISTVNDNPTVLSIRGTDNRSAGFAVTTSAEGDDPAGDRPALIFTLDGHGYRLSQVWETGTEGQTLAAIFAAPRTRPEEASWK